MISRSRRDSETRSVLGGGMAYVTYVTYRYIRNTVKSRY